MKGTDRNKPCPCGSGVKAKKCPNHNYEKPLPRVVDAARRLQTSEGVLEIDDPRARRQGRLSPAIIAALIHGGLNEH